MVAPMKEVVEEGQSRMVVVVGQHCNHHFVPKGSEVLGIHSRPGVGNRIQLQQVVLRLEPRADRLRLEVQVACHRTIADDSHNCCCCHHHDRHRMPMEQRRRWNLDDQEPIHPERLQQQEDHVPMASCHRQVVVEVRIHQAQPRCAVEGHLGDQT